jgi:hypothetical protein
LIGLDPGIHQSSSQVFFAKMDHRVKPGDDDHDGYDSSYEERSKNHPAMPDMTAPRRRPCRRLGLPASCRQIRTLSGAAKSDQGRGRTP